MLSKLGGYSFLLLALVGGGCTGEFSEFDWVEPGSVPFPNTSIFGENEVISAQSENDGAILSTEGDAGTQSICGDGFIDEAEACDDGNDAAGDGCFSCAIEAGWRCDTSSVCTNIDECTEELDDCDANATCTDTPDSFTCECEDGFSGDGRLCSAVVKSVVTGGRHTCALLGTGAVRCWGFGDYGQLGYGNRNNIGDDESPASAGDVDVGGIVTQLAAGENHTCALLDTGAVRCWGFGGRGLGQAYLGYTYTRDFGDKHSYGNANDIGDDESPASAGNVHVGGTVTQLTAGKNHTCALLDTGAVRCWGSGDYGQLGYGNMNDIGDNESPASVGDVNVGGIVTQLATGESHTCALLNTGAVRCWGGGRDWDGELGYGNTNAIGDDETPASAGDVNVGGTVTQLTAGESHTCALLDTGAVRCWGAFYYGQLGYGNTNTIGDNETPASAGDVNVGGTVTQLAAGKNKTCALLDTGALRCWGLGSTIGDDETPASVGDVNVGGTVTQLAAGGHVCALLDTGAVRCWGNGSRGQLGYGNTNTIGDDETPASAGDVNVF